MTPTHRLKLADGYGEKAVELISKDDFLALVRCSTGAYWEPDRLTTKVVRTTNLTPLPQ